MPVAAWRPLLLVLCAALLLGGCSPIPDMPGPIGIPGL